MDMPDYNRTLSGDPDPSPDWIDDWPERRDEIDGTEPVHERQPTPSALTDVVGFLAGSFVVAATIFSAMVSS